VFADLIQDRAEGILVTEEDVHLANAKLIAELAERSRLPTIYPSKTFVQAGGLMSYGVDLRNHGSSLADVVDEILKGAKPGEKRQGTKSRSEVHRWCGGLCGELTAAHELEAV
jgi:putative tryptophan/tyrosine transport system substrate-binding protein